MVKYLQTAKSEDIVKCRPYQIGNDRSVTWVPTVEHASIRGAFLTKTPEEVYDSRDPPILDAMFSFNSKVFSKISAKIFNGTVSSRTLFVLLGICFVPSGLIKFQGAIDPKKCFSNKSRCRSASI